MLELTPFARVAPMLNGRRPNLKTNTRALLDLI